MTNDSTPKLMDLRDTFVVCGLSGTWPNPQPPPWNEKPYELGIHYVRKLREMVWAQIPRIPFICFTDREIPGIVTRYLPPYIKGWWFKMYVFAASNFPLGSRILCLDLDTCITGPLDKILSVPLDVPVFIRDAWFGTNAGSGMFSFKVSPETAKIWAEFPKGQEFPPYIHQAGKFMAVTDEHWIQWYLKNRLGGWKSWDELLGPKAVVSYKHHLHQSGAPLDPETRAVYFDGFPRPHEVVTSGWNKLQLPEYGRY